MFIDTKEDIINLPKIVEIKDNKLPKFTRSKIEEYLESVPPSTERAQLINILNYKLADKETIAERFERDHATVSHAIRNSMLLVLAGCANYYVATDDTVVTIEFEDGSKIG